MSRSRKTFLLVGIGPPLANRGCEAILRSSVDMLSEVYPEAQFVLSCFGGERAVEDGKVEQDKRITHRPATGWLRRFSADWWRFRVLHRWSPAWQDIFPVREHYMAAREADCALQIGGDNYSLDYGQPLLHMHLDRVLKSVGIPLVLWGSSVGPFASDPGFEREMQEHLKLFDLILARESETVSYLASLGIEDSVRLVADPAFTLIPKKPACGDDLLRFLERHPVGLNLSPLVGRYTGDGGISWSSLARTCLEALIKADCGPLLLVPHVTEEGNDDHAFLAEITRDVAGAGTQFLIVPPGLTAAEYKWVIAKLRVFIGARTHATIAALSSGVPTISIGYSMKAVGINKDIFGSLDWLIPVGDLSPQILVERLCDLLGREDRLRDLLKLKATEMASLARTAAVIVHDLLEGRRLG